MKIRARIPRNPDVPEEWLLNAMASPVPVYFTASPLGKARVLQLYDEFYDIEIELAEGVVNVALDVGNYTARENRAGAASAAERSEGSRSK